MKQLKATLCTIGDELLIGQVINTNSAYLARLLEEEGIHVRRHISISDEPEDIISTLRSELQDCDIVITTGGLGPTKDDRTKQCLAEIFGCRGWKESSEQMKVIENILLRRGIPMLDINKAQALVPEAADVIVNTIGTAPIMAFHDKGKALYAMPGVPFEAEKAAADVIDDIRHHFDLHKQIFHRCIMTYGIAESSLSKKIEAWEDEITSQGVHLAYLPSHKDGVKLRLSIYDKEDTSLIDNAVRKLGQMIPQYIYNYNESTLAETLIDRLKEKGLRLAIAESCTGGYLSSLITAIPGVSEIYMGSVTSYANEVKRNVLGVSKEVTDKIGVVSAECVEQMAAGVAKAISIATSGYAGPTGTNVGQVWIGVALPGGRVESKEINVPKWNSRRLIIERSSAAALHFALSLLSK